MTFDGYLSLAALEKYKAIRIIGKPRATKNFLLTDIGPNALQNCAQVPKISKG